MAHLKATLSFASKLVEKGIVKSVTSSGASGVFAMQYYKFGLLKDDLIKENEISREALRRLPDEVYQERQFRLARAIHLSTNKNVLPQNEWTKPDENIFYLRPIVEQVLAEIKEKEDWDSGKIQ